MAEIDRNPRQITRLRVEDQKNLESISHRVTFFPTETEGGYDLIIFDANLDFEGEVFCNDNIYTYGTYGIIFNTYDVAGEIYRTGITYNTESEEFIFTVGEADGTTYEAHLSPNAAESQILTNTNVKTVFGNSLYGTGNIELYVHYLSIIADSKFFYGVVVSSNNTDATGSGQGLTSLFKAHAGTSQQYITVSDIDHNVVGLLLWNGSQWYIQLANDNFVTITSVTDRVETI